MEAESALGPDRVKDARSRAAERPVLDPVRTESANLSKRFRANQHLKMLFDTPLDDSYQDSYLVHMASYSVAEAKNNLPKLLDRALAGEDVRITRRGTPIAKIVPEAPRGASLDAAWLRAGLLTPAGGADFDSAALLARMRDDYRY